MKLCASISIAMLPLLFPGRCPASNACTRKRTVLGGGPAEGTFQVTYNAIQIYIPVIHD
jgi:hypothetical protein